MPISETFGASNWALGAISVNPTTADIGVTTSVSAVALGQNSTYNITITNNGPSPANTVTLTDTMPVTNLTLVSVTPSTGHDLHEHDECDHDYHQLHAADSVYQRA